MRKFRLIAITPPDNAPSVLERAVSLLETDEAEIVHLRFPGVSEPEMRKAIESIPSKFYSRVKVHSHFHLANEYGLRGCHLNGKGEDSDMASGVLSRSCHSLSEVSSSVGKGYEYVTLSPIFDSISKIGYCANNALMESELPEGVDVVALGGVTPQKFEMLEKHGFSGAAMIGAYFVNKNR